MNALTITGTDTSFVPGWSIGLLLLILTGVVIWAALTGGTDLEPFTDDDGYEMVPPAPGMDGDYEDYDDFADFDVVHLMYDDGFCRISLDGQGHLPCEIHGRGARR